MIEWKPVVEMPADMRQAFIWRPGMPCWQIAWKDSKGIWGATFGLITPEIIDFEGYYFVPLTVVPAFPALGLEKAVAV